jgi:hypothetical protein
MSEARVGELARTPLPEVLRDLLRERATGILDLQNGPDQRRVFFVAGAIKGAVAAEKSLHLGQHLIAQQRIDAQQLARALARRSEGMRLGRALVAEGAVDAAGIEAAMRRLVADIVLGAFEWPGGAFRFTPAENPAPADILLTLSTPQLLLEGVRRFPEDAAVDAALGAANAPIRIPSQAMEILQDLSFVADEQPVVGRLLLGTTLAALERELAGSLGEKRIRRLVYGLLVVGAVAQAPPTSPAKTLPTVPVAAPPASGAPRPETAAVPSVRPAPPASPSQAPPASPGVAAAASEPPSSKTTAPPSSSPTPTVGSLAKVPLAELFPWIYRERLSGFLDLQGNGDQRRIFFTNGEVVSAIAGAATHHIGQYLKEARLVTEEQIAAALARRSEGVRLGQALVEAGAIDRERLDLELRRLVTDIIGEAFAWTSGTFRFTPSDRPVPSDTRLEISTANVILAAVRRIPSDEAVARALGDLAAPLVWASDPFLRLQHITLLPEEVDVIRAVDGKSSVLDLRKRVGLPVPRLDRLLLGLVGAGILRDPANRTESPLKAGPPTNVKVETSRRTVKLFRPKTAEITPEMQKEEIAFRRKKVLETYASLSKLAPHELVEVAPNATYRDLRWNYLALLEIYHPDNAFKPEYSDLKKQLEAVTRALARAYKLLAVRFGDDKAEGVEGG